MAVDWDAIQKASTQLENNMKNAHNEINELTFSGSSEDERIKATMKGSFALEELAISANAIDTSQTPEHIAQYLNTQSTIAINDAVNQIREYSKAKIAKLAGDFDTKLADKADQKDD